MTSAGILPTAYNTFLWFGTRYLLPLELISRWSSRDARLLPHVARVTNPYELKEERIDVDAIAENTSIVRASLPSDEWREVFIRRFKNFRKVCS